MLILRLSTSPGSVIHSTIIEMLHIAKTLDCRVEAEFNGVVVLVRPDSILDEVLQRYRAKRLEFQHE
jgi:hypothetical protein